MDRYDLFVNTIYQDAINSGKTPLQALNLCIAEGLYVHQSDVDSPQDAELYNTDNKNTLFLLSGISNIVTGLALSNVSPSSDGTPPTKRRDGSNLVTGDWYFTRNSKNTVVFDSNTWRLEGFPSSVFLGEFDNAHTPTGSSTDEIYYNTSDGVVYAWSGSSWVPAVSNVKSAFAVSAETVQLFLGTKSSPPSTRADGSPVRVDDFFFDSTLNETVHFTSSGWRLHGQDSGVFIGNFSSNPSQRVGGGSLQTGDTYINTGTKKVMVYNGSNWSEKTYTADPASVPETPDATTSVKGKAEFATQTEVDVGARNNLIVPPSALKANRLRYSERGDNLLINPEFKIWQRTTSYDPSSQRYGADRWWAYASPSGQTISLDTTSYGQGFAMKIETSDGSANKLVDVRQGLELTNGRPLTFNGVGKLTINIAFKYPSASNITLQLFYADNIDLDNHKLVKSIDIPTTGSLQIESVTFNDDTPNNGNGVAVLCIGGGEASSDHFLYHVELLEGDREPLFHSRPYSLELSMCQRYFERFINDENSGTFAVGWNGAVSDIHTTMVTYTQFKQTKVREPDITILRTAVSFMKNVQVNDSNKEFFRLQAEKDDSRSETCGYFQAELVADAELY